MKSIKLIIIILFLYIFVVDCVQSHLHDTDKSESSHIKDNPYATKNTYLDAILGYFFQILLVITFNIPVLMLF